MAQAVIAKVGDLTSHGGKVISGTAARSKNGSIASVGSLVSCPEHGIQKIVAGSTKARAGGKGIATAGSLTSCGAILLPNPKETARVTL